CRRSYSYKSDISDYLFCNAYSDFLRSYPVAGGSGRRAEFGTVFYPSGADAGKLPRNPCGRAVFAVAEKLSDSQRRDYDCGDGNGSNGGLCVFTVPVSRQKIYSAAASYPECFSADSLNVCDFPSVS